MNTVLVIDNNLASRKALCDLLTLQWPHLTVITAENGPKGLHLAHELKPDLILLEDTLPGLDSYQTAKVLRHLPETHSIPLIGLTHLNPTTNQGGLQETCHAWLIQPVTSSDLATTISAFYGVNNEITV